MSLLFEGVTPPSQEYLDKMSRKVHGGDRSKNYFEPPRTRKPRAPAMMYYAQVAAEIRASNVFADNLKRYGKYDALYDRLKNEGLLHRVDGTITAYSTFRRLCVRLKADDRRKAIEDLTNSRK